MKFKFTSVAILKKHMHRSIPKTQKQVKEIGRDNHPIVPISVVGHYIGEAS